MNVHIPDFYLVEELFVFGDIAKGVICQRIEVNVPDQRNVEQEVSNGLEQPTPMLKSIWNETQNPSVLRETVAKKGWAAAHPGSAATTSYHGCRRAAWCPKKSAENYVQRLIDPGHADNWPSAPIGTLDHIIILST